MTAPKPGEAVVQLLQRRLPDYAKRGAKVGLIELDEFPWSVAEPMIAALGQANVVDAGPLFASIRQPADAAEVGLAERSLAIAQRALAAIPADTKSAAQAMAAADHAARLEGAEEVLFRVAPDLSGGVKNGAVLQRIETDAVLASRWALQISMAYKGVWVRSTRSLAAGAEPASWAAARTWFSRVAGRIGAFAPETLSAEAPGKLNLWLLEACVGTHPLSVVAHGPARTQHAIIPPAKAVAPGALAVLSVELALPEGAWHASAPVIPGGGGTPARVLTAGG
jgi:hypothetical protein